jgi:phosphonate transport system substrate-binding protein
MIWNLLRRLLVALTALAFIPSAFAAPNDGSPQRPLRVMLIPADGGTATGTLADFKPLFDAITADSGLHFSLRVGSSYSAVVEAMKGGLIEIAWFGPVAYVQAREAGAAELLAVSVRDGESSYYAGIFVRANAPIKTLVDLRGRRMSFGDINSTSSFSYQVAMLLEAGLDPARDLSELRITGSHAASLAALSSQLVDAACLSFNSYLRAVDAGSVRAEDYRVLARSEAIPNPPLAMSTALPKAIKQQLKTAFARVHQAGHIAAASLRGYGNSAVDRYDAAFPEAAFDRPAQMLERIGDQELGAILHKAGQR